MKRFLKPVLAVLILLLIAGGGYWFWATRPAQIIARRSEALLDLGRYQKINLDTREDKAEDIAKIFAPQCEIAAPAPIPSGSLDRAALLAALEEFHLYLSSCQIEELDRKVAIEKDTSGKVILPIRATLVFGKHGSQTEERTLFLQFQKSADWKITRLEIR